MIRIFGALLFVLVGISSPVLATDAEDIAISHLRAHLQELQLTELDLQEYVVTDRYVTEHSGVTHLYFTQTQNGIRLYNGILGVHLDANNRVFHVTNRWVGDLATKISATAPTLSADDAILHVTDHLNLIDVVPAQRTQPQGPTQEQVFEGGQLSLQDIAVNLVYHAGTNGEVRLAWRVNIAPADSSDWWDMLVDAQTGVILEQFNWTVQETFTRAAGAKATTKQVKKAASASPATKLGGPAYRALDLPLVSPDEGSFTLITNPANATASPFGWHDTNGVAGAEFTTTRGNNVHAYQDRDGNDAPAGDDPDGGAGLVFDITANLANAPSTYTDAATVNLFVWNNFVHDILHFYGFTEAAGNFQTTNYSGQGLGGDYVQAQSQSDADGSSRNNANFSTPPDGQRPRMRMFEWVESATASLTVNSPAGVAGTYLAAGSSFGTAFPNSPGLTGNLLLVNDGTGTTSDGCEALVGFTAGRVALIDRGGCEFGVKVLNAQNAGAIAAIVINNQPHGTTSMGPGAVGGSVTIPSLMISQADGTTIRNASSTVNATMIGTTPSLPNRDSDFDNGVIAHEYGHGVSNRLTGGPSTTSCLGNQEQMGEGWSDFLAYALTRKLGDDGETSLGVGTYVSFQPVNSIGIRSYPYSTDMTVNPLVYSDIALLSVPHGVGSVWASMLWDLYWAFVDVYGFSDDIYNGTAGNNMAIRLVLDGMKLQPCSPGFVDGRDAILAADQALNAGANECLIWSVFARRGLGVNAAQGSSNVVNDGTQDFTSLGACCTAATIQSISESLTVCEGDSASFSVEAIGSDLTYQWQLNNVDINGATSASYTVASVTTAEEGSYTCVVTNGCSTEESAAATLAIADPYVFGNAVLPDWNGAFDAPACGDHNANEIVDVIDFVHGIVE